ncbi:hypothetical protein K504DRAFT_456374 [Pleomassaria siparia CBS 279.74]|uniref:TNT domain-containing protein n=1 Tax=Pleomassaria siparia CBS 279.74 TaxID=1314801 RepID=A0A6G1K6C3_9PLEO|nr:hypothetical protein K504DRAFT_456374 [Pleomassaria siparia CBS 279.74]
MKFTILSTSVLLVVEAIAAPVVNNSPVWTPGANVEKDYDLGNLTLPPGYQLDRDLRNITRCGPSYCARTVDSGDPWYVCGDNRLGPVILPSCLPLSTFVGQGSTYRRFGGLCPGEFLAKWTQFAPAGQGWFLYPYTDGFANNTAGDAIRGDLTLTPGMLVDRFGGTPGSFVAPGYSPYAQRALPPANLDFDARNASQVPYNYHLYEIRKPTVVAAGPVAPWFGRPGYGTQFELSTSVRQLLEDGAFVEIQGWASD